MARNIHWTSLYFPSNERYISELEVLNNKLEVQLKADLKKIYTESLYPDLKITFDSGSIQTHKSFLKSRAPRFFSELCSDCSSPTASVVILNQVDQLSVETFVREIYTHNKIKEKEILIVEYLSNLRQLKQEILTPESEIYVTPEWSPTEGRYNFGHSRCTSDSGLSSLHCTNTLYYSLVTVDDVYSCESADILEKELAEQDQLFKSFKSIISRDSKDTKSYNKQFTLRPLVQKPHYYLKYTASDKSSRNNKKLNIKLCVNSSIKEKYILKSVENSCKPSKNVGKVGGPEKVFALQEGLKETFRSNSTYLNAVSSHFIMSKTKIENDEVMETESVGLDSCLEAASSGYFTGTSPRDQTASVSESAFGGDLTEMATSDEIPHDNDQSARSSSMSSDAGTWDSTFVQVSETISKQKTTMVELCDHDNNVGITHNDNLSMESKVILEGKADTLSQESTINHSTLDQGKLLNNKYNECPDNCSSVFTDIHKKLSKSASASHTFTDSNGDVKLDCRESGLFNVKNNFFINAASLIDENEMTSIHPNSLNYTNELLEVHCHSSFSKPVDDIEKLSENVKSDPTNMSGKHDKIDNQIMFEENDKNNINYTNVDHTPTDAVDLEKRRSSLIRRNTFELELDDERLAVLRKECEKHKVQQNASYISSFDSSSVPQTSLEMAEIQSNNKVNVPNSLPGVLCTNENIKKYDIDMHSPDSLNNDGPLDNTFEKESYSLPFQSNTGVVDPKKTREETHKDLDILSQDKSCRVDNAYFDDSCQEVISKSNRFVGLMNNLYNNSEIINRIDSTPILPGSITLKDFQTSEITYSSPILYHRKTECAPIVSGGSVIELEPVPEVKHKQSSSFSSSWIVDMSKKSELPVEDCTNQINSTLSRVGLHEDKLDELQKPVKSNNSSLGFFIPLDDPLDEKSSRDSGYKSSSLLSNKDIESVKSVSRGDAMSSTTNLSSCSSSCGFYVDLKDAQEITEKPNVKDTSSQDKRLFSMFIDIGDSSGNSESKFKTISPHKFKRRNNRSHSGLQTLKRDEKSRLSDSQMSSESSLELTDPVEFSREKQSLEKEIVMDISTTQETDSTGSLSKSDGKNKNQGFYMFIESEQSPVPQRRILPSGQLPASHRHSWNSECNNFNIPGNGTNFDDVVPKRAHLRSHSVSVNKSLDVMFNVDQSSSVSPLVKVSTSNSTGYETGPSSMDNNASKSYSKNMSSWQGSVKPSVELQKVIARCDGKERKEIKHFYKTGKIPLETKHDVDDEIFESIDKSDEFSCINSKGDDQSNVSNESSNTAKHGNSTFLISDVSNIANATSNDLEITTPTCDVISQLSKDDSDKTETDFDDVGDKKLCEVPRTPEHSISQVEVPVIEQKFGFVKLSDMDKEPNKMHVEEKISVNRMSRSIPEASWIESKMMTRSATSRSLSRLFPHLNTSARNITPDSGDHDTDFSEISSMQSSMDPSALEVSTEDTEASSCANGPVSRLGEDLLRMFLDEISPDVTVEVGGRRIKAHKCILSSRCQYFAAILSGGWVESAGNVISLQGFSYSAVHFALCHIYSGASNIPDSINIVELATLADMLCLEGLKEVIMYTLKVKYCHFFHKPCPMCTVGVLECLPLAAAYGLDEIYRKSLRWITKYFVRVWPTKGFAALPRELLDKCYKQHIVHMTVDNVLETVMCCSKLQGLIPNVRWSEPIFALVLKLNEAAVKFVAQHFSEILSSDMFMSLGKEQMWTMSQLEETLLSAAEKLPPDQACKCHSHLYKLSSVINTPESVLVVKWNEGFLEFLNLLSSTVESCLLKQAARASRTPAWTLMEPQLRHKIQDTACLVIVPGDDRRRARHLLKRGEASNLGKRTADLLPAKSTVTDISTAKKTTLSSRLTNAALVKPKTPQVTNKTENSGSRPKTWPYKTSEVKSRYLEPKASAKQSPSTTNTFKQEKQNVALTARRNINKSIISSSDSSRTSSPAMKRSVPQRTSRSLPSKESKRNDNLTMSNDSLADPSTNSAKKKTDLSKTQQFRKIGIVEKNIQSLPVKSGGIKVASTEVTSRVVLSDSKAKATAVSKIESEKPKYSPVTLSKRSSCQSSPRVKNSPVSQVKSTVNSTPSPSARQNVLSPKEKSHLTVDTKSTLLKRNTTYRVQSAKPSSPMKVPAIKSKEIIGTSPSAKGNNNKVQSKVNSSKKFTSNNSLVNNRKTDSKAQPLVGSRSGTFLKDEPTVLKKTQVVDCSE